MSRETEEAMKEIIAMGPCNGSSKPDENKLTLEGAIAEPTKQKATPPPTLNNSECPVVDPNTKRINMFAEYVIRKDENGKPVTILSSFYVQTRDTLTSCVAPYVEAYVTQVEAEKDAGNRMIPYGVGRAIIDTQYEMMRMAQYCGPVKSEELVARIEKLMKADNVTPITKTRGTRLPPPVPAEAYKTRATTA